jgi:predicted PurR-regulated permease PerM
MKVSGVSVQVSGRGGAKYCWDVVLVLLLLVLLLVLVLVLVLDPIGTGFTNSIFSITRTRTTTRNVLIGISGLRHLSLCFQTAPQGPLFPSAVSEKA